MRTLLGIITKEFLLLVRDIPGMIILFLMPTVLIITVSATQDSAFRSMNQSMVEVLVVDYDTSIVGRTVEKGLNESGFFRIIKEVNGYILTEAAASDLIARGIYQIGIIIPTDASEHALQTAEKIINKAFNSDTSLTSKPSEDTSTAKITIYLDPAIRESYRVSVTSSMNRLIQAAEIRILMDNFMKNLPLRINEKIKGPVQNFLFLQLDTMEMKFTKELQERMGTNYPKDFSIDAQPKNVNLDLLKDLENGLKIEDDWTTERFIDVDEIYASSPNATIEPTIVQNNVPAFALFAMFFIVIPLAGSLITERNEGTYNRLRTLPVSYISVLGGKIIVYAIVCLTQLFMMILVGMYLLPLLYGMPALEIGHNYFAFMVAALASAMAAIGFGLLVGTFASTMSQAGMFGSFMVLILGILGGIFMPIYLMPEPLKNISIISPIRWGIDCFLDIFVREGTVVTIFANVARLFLFFAVSLSAALFTFVRRR